MSPDLGIQLLRRLALLLFLTSSLKAADLKVDYPDNFDPPSKEEGGILSSIVSSYVAVRDAVRFAYDEIIYFERMYDTYERITGWFDGAKQRAEDAFDASTRLVTEPSDFFTTLERMEKVFDKVDNLVLYEPRRLDRILAGGELYWDLASRRNNAYTGVIVPNTAEVLDYIEGLFITNKGKPLTPEQEQKMSLEEMQAYADMLQQRERLFGIKQEDWPEERLRAASSLIASSALANSGAYKTWAIKSSHNIESLDNKFANLKGVNEKQLAAAWFALENANANNKMLRHSLEELKLMQGLLGLDMWTHSQRRAQALEMQESVRQLQLALRAARP